VITVNIYYLLIFPDHGLTKKNNSILNNSGSKTTNAKKKLVFDNNNELLINPSPSTSKEKYIGKF